MKSDFVKDNLKCRNESEKIISKLNVMIESNKLIGIDLYNIFYKEDIKEEIHTKAMASLKKLSHNFTFYNKKKHRYPILISLALIAQDNYDGNFWDYVHKKYQSVYDDSLRQLRAENVMREVLRGFKTQYKTNRWINYVLFHAMVPINYLNEYFNIALEIYINDLRASLPDDNKILDSILDKIISQIAFKEYNDETLHSSVMGQSYKLIKTTKVIMEIDNYRTQLVRFTRNIIRKISEVSGLTATKSEKKDDFLSKWCEKWYREIGSYKLTSFTSKSRSLNRKKMIRYKPSLSLEDFSKLYINTMTVFLPKNVDCEKLKIIIYSGEEVVYENDRPVIIDNGFSVELESEEIPISWDPFNMSYEIAGLKTKTQLFKGNYYLFDMKGKYITSRDKIDDDVIIISKYLKGSNIDRITSTKYYEVGQIMNSSEYFTLDNKVVSLKKIEKPMTIGPTYSNVIGEVGKEKIDIYSEKPSLMIPHDKDITDLVVFYNGIIRNYSDSLNKCEKIEKDINENNNILLLEDSINGLNNLELKIYKKEKIEFIKISYLYYEDLRWNLLEDNETVLITDNYSLNNKYKVDKKNGNVLAINITSLKSSYILKFNIMYPLVRKGDECYEELRNYYFAKDFNIYNDIEFCGFEANELHIYNLDLDEIFMTLKPNNRNSFTIFKFDIGANLKVKGKKHNFRLDFYNNDELANSTLFLNHILLDSDCVYYNYDEETDQFTVGVEEYLGDGDIKVQVWSRNSEMLVEESINKIKKQIKFKGFSSNVDYIVKIVEDTNIELYVFDFRITKKTDLVGKKFKVTRASIDLTNKYKKDMKSTYININHTFIVFDKYCYNEKIYYGRIYFHDKYGNIRYFNKIKTVKVSLHQENIEVQNDILTYINTDDGDALYLDNNRSHILDTEDEPLTSMIATGYEYFIRLYE